MTSQRTLVAKTVLLVTFLAASVGVFLHYYYYTGNLSHNGRYRVQAVVADAGGLAQNAKVTAAGIEVGKVRRIALRGGNAVLELAIDDEYAPVYRNATVRIRERTPVGERLVEIDRGGKPAAALPPNGVLPLGQAAESVAIDDVLSTLDARTQRHLRAALVSLRKSLGSRGETVNRLFETSAALVREGGPVVEVLSSQRPEVASLIDDLGTTMRALGERETDVQLLARQAKVTSEAVAARDRQLRDAFAELPRTLTQVRASLPRLSQFSGSARPVLADLRRAMIELRPTLLQLRPAAHAARPLVRELGRFAPVGKSLLADVRPFAAEATAAIPPLARFLKELAPMLRYMSPYTREIGAAFPVLASTVGGKVAIGATPGQRANIARVHLIADRRTLAAVPPELADALDAILEAGLVSARGETGNNSYPAPGTAENPQPPKGPYPRVEADR